MLLVDCQSDMLDHLDTRLVVPLILADSSPPAISGLTPVFDIDGDSYVMATQFAASLAKRDLGQPVVNLAPEHNRILAAADMLMSGF